MEEKYLFIVPQKAMIKDGEKFLILKRSPNAATYPNRWDFPGGRLETGENAQKGLEREVLEEIGLEVDVKEPVFVFQEKLGNHFDVFIVHSVEIIEGNQSEVKLSEEHTDFKWATREEILGLPIENFLRAFLETNPQRE